MPKRVSPTSHGSASEKRIAKELDAKLMPASGAIPGCKSDLVLDDKEFPYRFRGECKATINDQLMIQRKWFIKIQHEALERNQLPLVFLSFVFGNGQPKQNGDWVAMRVEDFEDLLSELPS